MADKQLRWGLLSTARINRALIPALRASKRNRLTTVASRNLDDAQAYAREWGIPRAHGSYDALLADAEVDVIYVSLPNSLHAEWSIKALQAGKHVLCEKPLALSVREVDAMEAAARANAVVLAEAFMYMHHEQTKRVQGLVQGGTLGRLQIIKGAFSFVLRREGDVRLKPELGGGSIWDVGCYPISYARLMAGTEPEQVFGSMVAGEDGVDMTFAGQLCFPNNVLAQFDCGFQTPGRAYMEMAGSEGYVRVPSPFKPGPDERIEVKTGERVEFMRIKGKELYLGEVEDMADAVLNGKQPTVSIAQSRGNVATITALLESARTGKPVRV